MRMMARRCAVAGDELQDADAAGAAAKAQGHPSLRAGAAVTESAVYRASL
jgi:hypothetical protein